MKTGEVVAIKQITLANIPKTELDAMMARPRVARRPRPR